MIDLSTMQTVRLKGGIADAPMVAAVLGIEEAAARVRLATLVGNECAAERGGRYRITPTGRDALGAALEAERNGLDAAAVAVLYADFTARNATFKQLVTDWQLRHGQPNDHADSAYDQTVLGRLDALHVDFAPVADRIAATIPRLQRYPDRLRAALERVKAGEHKFFVNPMVDSYHQVWFELHEELIGVAGLKRQAEAAAGRAE